jgi:hypothetical protein
MKDVKYIYDDKPEFKVRFNNQLFSLYFENLIT